MMCKEAQEARHSCIAGLLNHSTCESMHVSLSRPLPGPPNVASKLHEKALESIDQWADKYGAYYQQVCALTPLHSCELFPMAVQGLLSSATPAYQRFYLTECLASCFNLLSCANQ